ncbi:MAG: nucleoside hydrolase [Chloroflexota bacterium]
MPKKIIIDTDPGVDDAMAILFAFNSPEVEVIGLTTIFGNVTTDLGTQNGLRIVELAQHPQIPVAHGSDRPLYIPLDGIADFVHGHDGLGNTNQPPPAGQPDSRSAAQFIVEMVMSNPGEITLVPIGPLTNLALALAIEPKIVQNVVDVVLMGGAATVNGNVNPAAEANIAHDPHAADLVFNAGWPVTMVGLDVTEQVIMEEAYLRGLKDNGGRSAAFIWDITRFYQNFHFQAIGLEGLHTHDPSAIAYVIDPSLFTTIQGGIRVITEGVATGLTLLDRRPEWPNTHAWSHSPKTNVCVGVDAPRLRQLYQERILRAT